MLSGCDSANQMVDKAQETANQKAELFQNKIEGFNFENLGLNSDFLKNAPEPVLQMTSTVSDAMNADLTNIAEADSLKARISNAYSCLVDASSVSTAQDVMKTLLENITSMDIRQLIESGIEEGKKYQECVFM